MVNKYLDPLMEKKFIEFSGGMYYTTHIGLEFLEKYTSLINVWNNGLEKKLPR